MYLINSSFNFCCKLDVFICRKKNPIKISIVSEWNAKNKFNKKIGQNLIDRVEKNLIKSFRIRSPIVDDQS